MSQNVESALIVRMEASLRKFERQMEKGRAAAEKAATGSEVAWQRSGQQIAANADRATAGLQRLTNVSGRGRFVLQNTANQIGDIAVQMGSGTSATRALGQQLPQLLGGFGALGGSLGLLGPLLGTVAALGIPLAGAFLMAGQESETLDDRLKQLGETIKELETGIEFMQLDVFELTEKYGEAASRVREFALAQAEIRADQVAASLRDQVDLLDDVINGYMISTEEGLAFERTLQRIQEDFGVTRDVAMQMKDQFRDLFIADGFPEQQAALQAIITSLQEAEVPLSQIPEDLKLALLQMIELSNETDRAAKLMADLRAESAGVSTGVPLYKLNLNGDELLPPPSTDKPKSTPSGGGGRRGGGARVDPRSREAARIYDQTRTAAEKYAAELENLNQLREAGYLSEDTHMRAVAKLGEQLNETGNIGEQMGKTISDALADMVVNFDNARDAAAGLLQNLARMFATSAFNSLGIDSFISGLFGSANGNVFSGGRAVTAFANGGVVSGPTMFPMRGSQTGLMGEAGPEAIMPLTRLANGKLGVQASGGGSNVTFAPVIDARGADAAAVARIEAALAKAQAEFQNRVISTVQTAQKRRAL